MAPLPPPQSLIKILFVTKTDVWDVFLCIKHEESSARSSTIFHGDPFRDNSDIRARLFETWLGTNLNYMVGTRFMKKLTLWRLMKKEEKNIKGMSSNMCAWLLLDWLLLRLLRLDLFECCY